MTTRTLKVAALQLASALGDVAGNLTRATRLAERAAAEGAQLALFPELMPGGYAYDEALWLSAEPREGPTAQWLSETSRATGLWLATTYLEAEGEDFFNTLVLTRPDGTEAGRSRKETPAAYEAWFFRGEASAHVIDCELGRVGVGICMDNQLGWLPGRLHAADVDLVLQPHAWTLPLAPWATMTRRVLERDHAVQRDVAPHYARSLGVPCVFANQVGPWPSSSPGRWPKPPPSSFPGHSTIADSDGCARASADGEEAVVVAAVTLDPARKRAPPERRGGWVFPGPPLRGLVQGLSVFGRRAYARSASRRDIARALSSGRSLPRAASVAA